ncbi:VCBS repeat-containing protein [candidate division KSB1 bacterium]|nr:VCBS repeat-containing protein [candidate division KSB1 bacterium]
MMKKIHKTRFFNKLLLIVILVLISAPTYMQAQKKENFRQLPDRKKTVQDKKKKSKPPFGSLKTNSLSLNFTNITAEAGIGGPSEPGKTGGHSVVFADVDNDELPDLYVTMRFTEPMADLFFHNNNGLFFSEQAVARGIDDFDGGSHGACFADLDNDGDYDLINGSTDSTVSISAINNIFLNDGTGFFTDVTLQAGIPERSFPTRTVLAFDMENDGDLDLFCITNYKGSDDPVDETNEFYRNEGGMFFSAIDSGALFLAPACQGGIDSDYDNDGDIDIIAANRTGPVNILQNDGKGVFTQIEPDSIGITHRGREGISMADINNDGLLDLLMVGDSAGYYGHLYQNIGDGKFSFKFSFVELDGYMGGFADLDNDGDMDLVFAGDEKCYLNDGFGNFNEGPAIPVTVADDPRAVGFADIDNDGDMDFAVACKRSQNIMIRNDLNRGNWLKIKLISPTGQAGAFGAKVKIYPPGQSGGQLISFREARSSFGYLSQNDPVLHFGLGDYESVDVVVTFLDGSTLTRNDVQAGQTVVLSGFNFIPAPQQPAGPDSGKSGQQIQFVTGGVYTNFDNDVQYQFDWGDLTISSWGSETQNHIFSSIGLMEVKARVRSRIDTTVISGWSTAKTISINGYFLLVTIVPEGAGEIKKIPDKNEYLLNETVQLFPVPGAGYRFDFWEYGVTGNDSAVSILMNEDIYITANFLAIEEVVTVPQKPIAPDSAKLGVQIPFVTGGAKSNYDNEVEYQFNWNDGAFSKWGLETQNYVYTKPGAKEVAARARSKADTNVVSLWSEIKQIKISGYLLSVLVEPANSGFVAKNPHKPEYAFNDSVKLFPSANTNFYFSHWENDATGNDSPAIVIMDNDKNITARFNEINETVSAPVKPIGPDSGHVRENMVFVTDSAVSNLGHEVEYQFDWGDGILSAWGSNTGQHIYSYKDTMLIKARARCKIHLNIISDWSANHVLNIVDYSFKLQTSVLPAECGIITADPDKESYTLGEVIILNPVPYEHYKFLRWEGDIQGTAAPASLIMDSNKNIIAYFEKIKEVITQPFISSGLELAFRKQELQFVAGGAKSNYGHELEFQFQWDDSSYSSWGDSSRFFCYSQNGEFLIRTKARCKVHPDIVSDWSNDYKIQITGCVLDVTPDPDSSGTIYKEPNKTDYDYREIVTLTAIPNNGYYFKNWNGDIQDTTVTKVIILKGDTTLSALFDERSSVFGNKYGGKLQYELFQNYPNPFNQQTTIDFMLQEKTDVVLTIYNTTGQIISKIFNQNLQAGLHTFKWNGKDDLGNEVTSGVFLYQIKTDQFSQIRKMVMIK